jgi:hypothetical protein
MIDANKLRAWYSHRQGLDRSLRGSSFLPSLLSK